MPKLDGHRNPNYSSGYMRVAVLLILRRLNGELVADKISAYDREWVRRVRVTLDHKDPKHTAFLEGRSISESCEAELPTGF
ncbi:hypothetical protein BOTBODRAFT_37791 [Botryobasidium botryosum FD-172 SS1]|uniref:Uncharacterized protein n=1 Tax=Botryobasidium botryosum (strain FD-172 SS1) TaxID=930990 RepID=A0A067M9T7_BOTB1|nr:hypothetical protein BOTBODRAFT_37791 [Botryobasidium botryosum FD-172 SS1]